MCLHDPYSSSYMDSKGDEQTDFIISVSKVKHPEVVSFKNNIQKMLGGWYHLDIE